ncbi:uncharacterized protein [Amphiura filiformis]|uniref:uncharacterized protein isoform X1 n=1 Tax=Amphiura filiformis TaxID=82378 RepID=UPI003B217868
MNPTNPTNPFGVGQGSFCTPSSSGFPGGFPCNFNNVTPGRSIDLMPTMVSPNQAHLLPSLSAASSHTSKSPWLSGSTYLHADSALFLKSASDLPHNTIYQPKAHGSDVTQAAANAVSNIFPDKGFLRRTARVESNDGCHPSTFRSGYHGGIFQVDKVGFQDTQNTASHPGLTSKHQAIQKEFGIDWKTVQYSDLQKPLYSAIAARLLLSNKPEAIPSTVAGQAAYWKKHYNTAAGAGTEQKFIDANKNH